MFADLELSRRLERCEAHTSMSFIEARARLQPERGAAWIERGGTVALFDGADSPLTQTFCLGLFSPVTAADLDLIEAFFQERGAAVAHEVSPLAGVETFALLCARGYRPAELTSVMFQPLSPVAATASAAVHARIASPDEAELWSHTAAQGWSDTPGLEPFLLDLGRLTAASERATMFLAELDGRAVAAATLSMYEKVAHLAGASTLPAARNRGAQRALLEARLQHAAAQGCDLATMGASPGSSSQRNAERRGFRIAYTRVKWCRTIDG